MILIPLLHILSDTVSSIPSSTIEKAKIQVVNVAPISDKIKNLHIISCDLCDAAGKASYDVFVDGIINGITVLKRCCDSCLKSLVK